MATSTNMLDCNQNSWMRITSSIPDSIVYLPGLWKSSEPPPEVSIPIGKLIMGGKDCSAPLLAEGKLILIITLFSWLLTCFIGLRHAPSFLLGAWNKVLVPPTTINDRAVNTEKVHKNHFNTESDKSLKAYKYIILRTRIYSSNYVPWTGVVLY